MLDIGFLGMFKCLMFNARGQKMELPTDMKNYRAEDYDSFQLIPAHSAGWIILALVALAVIFEPVLR